MIRPKVSDLKLMAIIVWMMALPLTERLPLLRKDKP